MKRENEKARPTTKQNAHENTDTVTLPPAQAAVNEIEALRRSVVKSIQERTAA